MDEIIEIFELAKIEKKKGEFELTFKNAINSFKYKMSNDDFNDSIFDIGSLFNLKIQIDKYEK